MHALRLLGLIGLAATLSAPAMATSYDAVTDFNASSNDAGNTWTYRSGSDGNGSLVTNTGNTGASAGSLPYWNGSPYPYIVQNNTSTLQTNGGTVLYEPNALHLDGGGVGAEVRFTAPTAGSYDLSASFFTGDTSMVTHTVKIIENGTTSLYSDSLSNGTTGSFSQTVTLGAGDWLSFVSTADGGASFAGTSLQASLSLGSAVPEPATFAVLGVGLLGLGAARRPGRLGCSL